MFVNVVLLVDDCHCTLPVYPAAVKVDVLPVQMAPGDAVTIPAIGATFTVSLME